MNKQRICFYCEKEIKTSHYREFKELINIDRKGIENYYFHLDCFEWYDKLIPICKFNNDTK